jgi:hypothetical protein
LGCASRLGAPTKGPFMRKWIVGFALLVLAPFAAVPARAGATLLDYGMYAGSENGCDFHQAIGYCAMSGTHHLATATEIPGALGVTFGIHYALDTGRTPVRTIMVFPPAGLKNPRFPAAVHTYSHDEICDGSDCYDTYGLDFPWEIVPGIWSFQVWANGQMVLEKRFKVVLPDTKPEKKERGPKVAAL